MVPFLGDFFGEFNDSNCWDIAKHLDWMNILQDRINHDRRMVGHYGNIKAEGGHQELVNKLGRLTVSLEKNGT
jgi:hypothetical protein